MEDYGLNDAVFSASFQGENFDPVIGQSYRYRDWHAHHDHRVCKWCLDREGTIYNRPPTKWQEELQEREMREESHPHCRCMLWLMQTILAGTATVEGTDGADYVVKNTGELPDNYVSKEEAEKREWKPKSGNLWDMLTGAGIYTVHENRKGKLPQIPGRKWYEADINYHGGHRNSQRLLFSDDGLLFVTYNHYDSFYEIV